MNTNNIVIGGLVALALLIGGFFLFVRQSQPVGAISPTGPMHYSAEGFLQGATFGTRGQSQFDNAGKLTVGSSGNAVTAIQFGTCTGIVYAALATSTPIDCAVTGALTTDTQIDWSIPRSGSTNGSAFGLTDVRASTTAGYITGRIFQIGNTAGAVYGVNSTSSFPLATTSMPYIIFR